MAFYGESSYWLAKLLLSKGIAVTYLVAFLVAFRQYTSLVGEEGVLPVKNISLEDHPRARYSLFYFLPRDWFMKGCAAAGIAVSILTITGITTVSALSAAISWAFLWLLFLSFVNAGQIFYSHGWDTILLESGFLAIFLGGVNSSSSDIVIWLFRWILFRLMLGSALIKLHGDDKWLSFNALEDHFETQPFPNPLSRYLHSLRETVLRSFSLTTLTGLFVLPFLYLLPQPFAAIGGIITILFQLFIFLSGNYAWLNLITTVLAFSTFNDSMIASFTGFAASGSLQTYPFTGIDMFLALAVAAMSYRPLKNMLSDSQVQNQSYSPLHLVNSYGAFRDVPEERKEVILEAQVDGGWKEYRFHGKPEAVDRRAPQFSPYFFRGEYPFWFLAHGYVEKKDWLENMMKELLEGNEKVLGLVKEAPPGNPDKLRAKVYRYKFEYREDNYWSREPVKTILEVKRKDG